MVAQHDYRHKYFPHSGYSFYRYIYFPENADAKTE
jgi:hypothetical protein